MTAPRPKNLNLFTIHFPLPAIVSIIHRISGFALFLLIPFLLWGLNYSLTDSGFADLQEWVKSFPVKCLFWFLIIPFFLHLVAGIRHLLSDIQIGNSLQGGKRSALFTLIIAAVLILLAGIWLW